MNENEGTVPGAGAVCPPPSRFWKLAFEQVNWSAEEVEHLMSCRRCQHELVAVFGAVRARSRAVAGLAAGMAILASWARRRARQPFSLPRTTLELAGTATVDELAFTFDDLALKASRCRHRDGTYWLHLEHDTLPPGTLMQLVVAGDGQPAWGRYVMLRPGFDKAEAQALLDETVPAGADHLYIDRAGLPAPESAALLRTSFHLARRHDPVSMEAQPGSTYSAWQAWARRVLVEGGTSTEVRAVLAEMLADEAGAAELDRPGFCPSL
jgi:hypothetical protein